MNRHEIIAKYNLADTCCASVSLNDLLNFGRQETALVDFAQKQVYGAIQGSTALRSNIANLYSPDHSNRVEPVLPGRPSYERSDPSKFSRAIHYCRSRWSCHMPLSYAPTALFRPRISGG